jgi:hypothetical protein
VCTILQLHIDSKGHQQARQLDMPKAILLPSARHLKKRLTVSQSVSQSGKQSIRQSVGQAGRQTDGQKHTVWLVSVADYSYKQWGTVTLQEQSVVTR